MVSFQIWAQLFLFVSIIPHVWTQRVRKNSFETLTCWILTVVPAIYWLFRFLESSPVVGWIRIFKENSVWFLFYIKQLNRRHPPLHSCSHQTVILAKARTLVFVVCMITSLRWIWEHDHLDKPALKCGAMAVFLCSPSCSGLAVFAAV